MCRENGFFVFEGAKEDPGNAKEGKSFGEGVVGCGVHACLSSRAAQIVRAQTRSRRISLH